MLAVLCAVCCLLLLHSNGCCVRVEFFAHNVRQTPHVQNVASAYAFSLHGLPMLRTAVVEELVCGEWSYQSSLF